MSQPTTLLYLELIGEIIGGGQRSLLDIVTRLDPARYRPVVVCGAEGTLVTRLKELAVPVSVVPMPTQKYPWGGAARQAVAQLTRVMQEERVGLIHANQLRMALYGLQAGRRLDIPVVFHARITAADARGMIARWLDWFLARRCRAILAISQAVAVRFPWLAGTGRLHVVHNGIDLDAFAPRADDGALRRQWQIPPDAPLLGVIGLLEPRKGHRVLLRALPAILARHPKTRVLVVGMDAPGAQGYGEQLRRFAAEQGVASQVTFTGFLDDVPAILKSVTVCVMPVVQPEGLGRVVIEAGAMRCPVVATPLGGLREVIEDGVTGLLVPPGDADALALAILRVLDDPALAQRLGAAARQRMEAHFTLRGMMQRIHQIYDEIIASKN